MQDSKRNDNNYIHNIFFKLQIGVVNGSEEYKLGVLMNADMKSKKFQTFNS